MQLPDRYKSTGEIIKGGFGSVEFCIDQHLERRVAVKTIQDVQELDRLMDELSALMLMRSKHVVQIYDIIHHNAAPVGIVEEFIAGDDLLESVFPQSSLDSYFRILWQIAAGISDIHAAQIIHRDIKPNNMKLDPEGVLKIFDFGLSRNSGSNAETDGFKGTFYFAAPELFLDGKVAFTQAVDVYAFGATACYLADKKMPEELGRTPPAHAPKNTFVDKPQDIPSDLESILFACLHHNPLHRPLMSEVRDLLARYLLKDTHQAIAVYGNDHQCLNSDNKNVTLKYGDIGEIEIQYDGLRFIIKKVSGEVFINNSDAKVDCEIPGSCVVALGAPNRPNNERTYITFDVSYPEVVL